MKVREPSVVVWKRMYLAPCNMPSRTVGADWMTSPSRPRVSMPCMAHRRRPKSGAPSVRAAVSIARAEAARAQDGRRIAPAAAHQVFETGHPGSAYQTHGAGITNIGRERARGVEHQNYVA